jgi:LPXTG-motif cell wall-anchored protein
MDSQTMIIVAIGVVLALLALAAWLTWRKRETYRLEQRFGAEYGRAVDELGSRAKAESELKMRERRVEKLHIVPLSPEDATRFSQQWKALQGRFVDDPQRALDEADRLVRELMAKRGYPMADFERRAADISVDHPAVVEHFRAARETHDRGEADTERMRRAVVHYRALFDDLLEVQTQERRAPELETR